ncbi:MAG: hypothetical protein C4541_07100 [Candidatus Auribacter fodinae]|jgi:hypothetical protein|uniref:Prepilin-type N-terminal cleavage/methylation domain-containing protein n=1 Tax=Candidatus Auribacter fodinae TaxID=2093366 RepID=A0A3A4R359_9BACT|nr:MAG: hypothetical protein C4541_07100 [Candidatus Auribacter fodinae]
MKKFTLFELIILLSLPFIVAGMTVPKMTNNRDERLRNHCVKNMHEIELAITAWENDHGKNWPEGWIYKDTRTNPEYNLSGYISSRKVLDCPASDDPEHEYFYQRKMHNKFRQGVNCFHCHDASEFPHRLDN